MTTFVAVRAVIVRLWTIAGVRYLVYAAGGLALLAAAWQIWLARECAIADGRARELAMTRAAQMGEAAARVDLAHSRADARRAHDQAAVYLEALRRPAVRRECEGVLTATRYADGTVVERCEGRSSSTSTPVFPAPIAPVTPGGATAGMGAAAAGALGAAAAAGSLADFRWIFQVGPGWAFGDPGRAVLYGSAVVRVAGPVWVGAWAHVPAACAGVSVGVGVR